MDCVPNRRLGAYVREPPLLLYGIVRRWLQSFQAVQLVSFKVSPRRDSTASKIAGSRICVLNADPSGVGQVFSLSSLLHIGCLLALDRMGLFDRAETAIAKTIRSPLRPSCSLAY